MDDKQTTLESMASALGTVMMMSWILFLGPVGALLLLGVGYAIVLDKFWLGVACGVPLFFPLLITVVWAPFGWLASFGKRSTQRVVSPCIEWDQLIDCYAIETNSGNTASLSRLKRMMLGKE